jgi:hypothetical protein
MAAVTMNGASRRFSAAQHRVSAAISSHRKTWRPQRRFPARSWGTRLEMQGLKVRRNAHHRSTRDPELGALVSGVAADANSVADQMARRDSRVFQIVYPRAAVGRGAQFERISVPPEASVNNTCRKLRLAYQRLGCTDRNQSVPAHFSTKASSAPSRVCDRWLVI